MIVASVLANARIVLKNSSIMERGSPYGKPLLLSELLSGMWQQLKRMLQSSPKSVESVIKLGFLGAADQCAGAGLA